MTPDELRARKTAQMRAWRAKKLAEQGLAPRPAHAPRNPQPQLACDPAQRPKAVALRKRFLEWRNKDRNQTP